jgi:DNA (cytosine-5)-methyltransferase 1
MKKLKLLDLFSGIGGFSLGLERTGGFETVAFCEYDEKAQKVLKKHWPDVPIYKDVRTLDYDGTVDIITGGYPCQPFSVAGKRKGTEDDRHLWPSMFSLIKKHKPNWVIGENVAGHINMGLDSVLIDLESEGYTVRTFLIPAVAINAPHRRDRVWIVANADNSGNRASEPKDNTEWQTKNKGREGKSQHRVSGSCEIVADTESKRKHGEYGGNSSKARKDECGDDKPYSRSEHSPTIVANTRHGTGRDNQPRIFGENGGRELQEGVGSSSTVKVAGSGQARETMADTNSTSRARGGVSIGIQTPLELDSISKCKRGEITENSGHWGIEPSVGRVANGIPRRMDRLKQLGNAVVPQIPEIIGNAILEAEGYNRNVQCN